MYDMAIQGTGKPTLLIKDNKVLATVRVEALSSNHASVTLTEGDYAQLIKPLAPDLQCGHYPVHKLVYLRFSPYSGMYLECNLDGRDAEAVNEWFEYTRIVDEFNLHYGMVPDTFKDVEGYRKRFDEHNSR